MTKRLADVQPPTLTMRKLVPLLIGWFETHARDLPWRRTRDPYAIWVSEIMLQQTQVNTVVPYYERWMRELPNVASLASASLDKLHKLWEGLGYYTRVRNMQKAAQHIVTAHAGTFPTTYEDVLALPGVGRYTAGAICSIAFNQPKPIVDGNVVRVLTRLFGVADDPREKCGSERLWRLATQLVEAAAALEVRSPAPKRNCAILNESLMELGALVCTPRQPDCRACPVVRHCVARRENRVDELPNVGPRPRTIQRQFAAFVLKRGERILVRQRDAAAVNGLLWEFPNIEVETAGSNAETHRIARRLFGVQPRKIAPLCTIRHSITRYRIQLDVYHASGLDNAARRVDGQWMRICDALELSFPSAHHKILRRLASSHPG